MQAEDFVRKWREGAPAHQLTPRNWMARRYLVFIEVLEALLGRPVDVRSDERSASLACVGLWLPAVAISMSERRPKHPDDPL